MLWPSSWQRARASCQGRGEGMTMTVEVWARTRGAEVAMRRRRVADLSGVYMVAEAE